MGLKSNFLPSAKHEFKNIWGGKNIERSDKKVEKFYLIPIPRSSTRKGFDSVEMFMICLGTFKAFGVLERKTTQFSSIYPFF
jgi:hypothetical protein